MLVSIAGPEFALSPGDQREFPDDEAGRLIEAGFAVATQPRQTEPIQPPAEPIAEPPAEPVTPVVDSVVEPPQPSASARGRPRKQA